MSHWFDYQQRFYDGYMSTVSSNTAQVGQGFTDYGTPYVLPKDWDYIKGVSIESGSQEGTKTPAEVIDELVATICPANEENYCNHTVVWAKEDDGSFTIVSKDLAQRWYKDNFIIWSGERCGWVFKCDRKLIDYRCSNILWCNEYTEENVNAMLEFSKTNSQKLSTQYTGEYGYWNVYTNSYGTTTTPMKTSHEFNQNLAIVREKANSLSSFIDSRKYICTVNQPTKLPTFQTMFAGGIGEKMDMSLLNFIGGEKFELKHCFVAEEHGDYLDTLGYDSVIFRFYSKDLDKYLDLTKNQCDKFLDNFKNFFQTYEEHMAKEEEKKIRRERRKLAKQEKEELEKIAIMATEESKGFGAWS